MSLDVQTLTFEEVSSRKIRWDARVESLKAQMEKTQQDEEEAKREVDILKGAIVLIQHILQEMNRQSEEAASSLATMALQETFIDQRLELKAEHTVLRNQAAVLLKLRDSEHGIEGDPMESFGGGAASLLGLVMRAITIVRHPELERILILDEPLAEVSAGYRQEAGKFLEKLCSPPPKGLGFKMLVVTHSDTVASAATKEYRAERIGGKTLFKEVKRDGVL